MKEFAHLTGREIATVLLFSISITAVVHATNTAMNNITKKNQ
jgi:hypothetical protein